MTLRVSALLLILLLAGCARAPAKLSEPEQADRWLDHQQDVATLSSWFIDGRVGIKTSRQSGSASLFWQQDEAHYEMRIVAPLGQGTFILRGSPNGVQMRGPDDLLLTAETPEKLMQKGLGWSVNLQGLRYWVRGLPQPETAYRNLQLDGYGRMSFLEQSGFRIEVQRYADVGAFALPEKLLIKSIDLQLKMLIKRWEIQPGQS